MKRPPKPAIDLALIGPELASLRAIAGDEMMHEAFAIVRERLALTPEKLALMIVRAVAPDQFIKLGEEHTLRGIGKADTLRDYKLQKLFPHFINGAQPLEK